MWGMKNSCDWRQLAFLGVAFLNLYVAWNSVDATEPILRFRTAFHMLLGGLLAFQTAVATHNFVHVPYFKSRWANKITGLFLSLIYGDPIQVYIPVHIMSHHAHTQKEGDIMRTSLLANTSNFVNFFLYYPTVVRLAAVYDYQYFCKQYKKGSPVFYQLIFEAIGLYSYNGLLLWMNWRKFLCFVFFTQMCGKWAISMINYIQHDGLDDDSDGFDFARNFIGWCFNFFLFNNGYHTIHHKQPTLHWSELPKAHERTIKPYMNPELDHGNLGSFLWKAFIYPGRRKVEDFRNN
eukprot:TRINITY_DN9273_c0_g1_i1.p1 TRINITY_DN9273_c0_g1~~TRINITY_DN9273_c0_g1_i1.p1  ORF type:complete len:292 (+),score=25.54 TRINITY_DN9273_c0_g1_i1:775-1650(+)